MAKEELSRFIGAHKITMEAAFVPFSQSRNNGLGEAGLSELQTAAQDY